MSDTVEIIKLEVSAVLVEAELVISAGPVDASLITDIGPQGQPGPPGPRGEPGPQGPIGPKGDQGAASTIPGPVGPVGPAGPQGDQGLPGADSTVPGPQGPAGATGATGAQGPPGADSTVPGPQGPAGATGSQGPPGTPGATGAQGPAGQGVPTGGTTGQVLTKTSATDFATAWQAPAGGGAPIGAEYITSTADATLSAERVLTDTATVTWDRTTAGQIKANVAVAYQPLDGDLTALAGFSTIDVIPVRTGTNTWANLAYGAGISLSSGALRLDGDLISLAGASATGALYYRSAADTWATVTIGTGLTFTSGTLAATGGGGSGNVSNVATPLNNQVAVWTDATHIEGDANLTWDGTTFRVSNGLASVDQLTCFGDAEINNPNIPGPIAVLRKGTGTSRANTIKGYNGSNGRWNVSIGDSAVESGGNTGSDFNIQRLSDAGANLGIPFAINRATGVVTVDAANLTGTPVAPTPATADSSTKVATTAFVKVQGYAPQVSPAFSGTPTAPTVATSDNSNSIATTSYVQFNLLNYAPLASPTFTGDPKAPTPATSDNDTSIATTAFVKAAIAAGGSAKVGFSAYAAVNQTGITNETWIKVSFASTDFNDSTLYSTSNMRWTPPAGRCQINAGVYYTNTTLFIGTPVFIAVYKNGAIFRHACGACVSSIQAGAVISMMDACNGTDYYEVWTFIYASAAATIDGTARGTFFAGSTL